jgi:hypothetical protein
MNVYHLFDGVAQMRYLSIFVFAVFLVPSLAVAAEPRTPRPLDPSAVDAFAIAQAQSAVVRSLVATLESSNVIVHIVTSRLLPTGIGGTTRFVTSRGGYRYVRITIAADLSKSERTTILGHELKHACEIATSEADDAESVKELFLKDGHRVGDDYYETRAALDAERQIRSELSALRTARMLQTESVVKFDY